MSNRQIKIVAVTAGVVAWFVFGWIGVLLFFRGHVNDIGLSRWGLARAGLNLVSIGFGAIVYAFTRDRLQQRRR